MRVKILYPLLALFLLCSSVQAARKRTLSVKQFSARVQASMNKMTHAKDSALYYKVLREAITWAVQCDSAELSTSAGQKGKFKYRQHHQALLTPLRPRLIDAGLYFHTLHKDATALTYLRSYITSTQSSLFATPERDLFLGQAAYYAARICWTLGRTEEADRWASIALEDQEFFKDAAELKVLCMKKNMQTKSDSTRYLVVLLGLHDLVPQNRTYSRLLMDYFASSGHSFDLKNYALDEIAKDSTVAVSWALYGEALMHQQAWAEAAKALKQAVSLDTTFVEACYNLGICLSAQAQQTDSSAMDEETKQKMLMEACKWMAKAKHLDPERHLVDWVKPLYQLYFLLGREEEAAALTSLINENDE